MAISLQKGKPISLNKEASKLGLTLEDISVGLGWDVRETPGYNFDLDAWAAIVNNKGLKKSNIVYFGKKTDESCNIRHMGDNLTGVGDGDDEIIKINLRDLPEDYTHILVGVTIYRASTRRQSFKDVENTFIRLYDTKSNKELCKFDSKFKGELGDFSTVLFAIIYRVNESWHISAIGNGSKVTKISDIVNAYSDYKFLLKEKENKSMAVNLSKGGKVSLAKVASDAGVTSLTKVVAGLGWDVNAYDGGGQFDLDAAAFMTKEDGKVRSDADFIFYNQKTGPGIEHTGDNRTGEGDGDDEQIRIDLTQIPADVQKISFTVTIFDGSERNQNFGMVSNSYIRLFDEVTGTELVRYDLGEDFSVETAIVVGELYRHNGEWKFNAVGQGFAGGLAALCGNFGVQV